MGVGWGGEGGEPPEGALPGGGAGPAPAPLALSPSLHEVHVLTYATNHSWSVGVLCVVVVELGGLW